MPWYVEERFMDVRCVIEMDFVNWNEGCCVLARAGWNEMLLEDWCSTPFLYSSCPSLTDLDMVKPILSGRLCHDDTYACALNHCAAIFLRKHSNPPVRPSCPSLTDLDILKPVYQELCAMTIPTKVFFEKLRCNPPT